MKPARRAHWRAARLLVAAAAAAAIGISSGCRAPGSASQTVSGKAVCRPADAVQFNGHWYKAFDEKTSWHEAKRKCESIGGYLACVETEAEQAFIAKLANGRYLSLGATDEATEDNWQWVNGVPFKYTCWMGGQPNNYGGCEHYLATYDGGEWVDVADDGDGFWMPTGYICEWDK